MSSPERRATPIAITIAILALGCTGNGPVTPPPFASCDGTETEVLDLEPLSGLTLTGDAVNCFALAGGGATYLLVPQLAGAALPYGGYSFAFGAPSSTATSQLAPLAEAAAAIQGPPERDAQMQLDGQLRRDERRVAGSLRGALRAPRPTLVTDPPVTRDFSVLATLAVTPEFDPVRAELRFAGVRVLVYLDTLVRTAYSTEELEAMGRLYDEVLGPAVFDTFGGGTDIDGNGRVILLLTPTVNAMVSAASCAVSGYVRGFFYSHDLASTAPTSNQGEVFYSYVPDESGLWSCPHTKSTVAANTAPTFVHELQHLVSFGEHALLRNGGAEEPWLNEGLSHIAEELGSRYYEARFPSPSGRTDPAQIFPDSSSVFITPNLLYSYRFLFSSPFYSITSCAPGSFCTLAERGASWLFLRWLADLRGPEVLQQLVRTPLTGRANLEAVAGESTASLLGDFAIAVAVDSVDGVSREDIPARYRVASRNLRRIYRALFEAYGIAGGISRPYPIAPAALASGARVTGTMRPGTLYPFRIQVGSTTAVALLRFGAVDETAFPLTSGAQVSIFRLP